MSTRSSCLPERRELGALLLIRRRDRDLSLRLLVGAKCQPRSGNWDPQYLLHRESSLAAVHICQPRPISGGTAAIGGR